MSIEVKAMEDHEATPEYLQYMNIRANAMMLASALARKDRRPLALKIKEWVDQMPDYEGQRMKEVPDE